MQVKTVPQALSELGTLYEERAALYGDNYKKFGHSLHAIMGTTVLRTPDDYNRFGILVQIFSKFTRYAEQFENGGHADSLDDTSVYCQMLQELDAELKARKK